MQGENITAPPSNNGSSHTNISGPLPSDINPTESNMSMNTDQDSNLMEKRRGGWPKGRKRRRGPRDMNAPKQPLTGYVRYLNENREKVRGENPGASFSEVTKILACDWSKLDSTEKQKYLEQAEKDKERYMKELEQYQQTEAYRIFKKQQQEKKRKGKQMQKRRKIIMDTYFENLAKEQGIGDLATASKAYANQKQMSLLESTSKEKETSGNMNAIQQLDSSDALVIETPQHEIAPTSTTERNKQQDLFEREVINVLKANIQQPSPQVKDPDEMFFLSTLPLIKKLKTEEKIDFQIKYMELLKSYITRTSNDYQTPIPTNCPHQVVSDLSSNNIPSISKSPQP